MDIVAHRGASYLAPFENTIESFEVAIQLKCDMVEFDVRKTVDGKLIVFHDSVFNESPIAWQSYEQIEMGARDRGFEVPTLEDVVKLCHGKIRMDIEIKEAGFEKELLTILHHYLDYEEYTVKSFVDKAVKKIKKLDDKVTTGLLIGRRSDNWITRIRHYFPEKRLRACHADFISPYYKYVTNGFMKRMKRQNIPVYVWTVNDTDRMKLMLKRHVDGLITDKPDAGMYVRNTFRNDK